MYWVSTVCTINPFSKGKDSVLRAPYPGGDGLSMNYQEAGRTSARVRVSRDRWVDGSRESKGAGVEAGIVLMHSTVFYQAEPLEKFLPPGL